MKKITITIFCFLFAFNANSQENRRDLRKNSPNRIILQLGGGIFSNLTYDWDPTQESFIDDPNFQFGNVTYSGMIGLRSGFNTDNYRFSSTGRDKMRGNVVGLFYQNGTLNDVGLGELEKNEKKIFIESLGQDVKFTELQVGVVWREFLRISGGKGSVKTLQNLNDYTDLENVDYTLFTTGVNLRFGRLCPTFNWTLMSADNFETTMSRFDIQICMNIYVLKKILHKDKHLIRE